MNNLNNLFFDNLCLEKKSSGSNLLHYNTLTFNYYK